MSLARDPSLRDLNDCGCCEGLTARTPTPVANRPGLSAIAYRIGAHPQFKQSMLSGLSDFRRPALRRLNTRDDDDFSIALLDAWATVADGLTFYQERIANESYLRTATERVSIVELARALGYELMPGVAASTYLSFTLEDGPGAPGYATIDKGTKVQSLPGPGETPQTFETVEKIEARADWNAIRPHLTTAPSLSVGIDDLVLEGVDLNLKAGDALLILESGKGALRRITGVRLDGAVQQTRLKLEKLGPSDTVNVAGATKPEAWVMRVKAAPFGHNAPLHVTMAGSTVTYAEWPLADADKAGGGLHLDAVYESLHIDSWIVIERPGGLGGGRVIGRVATSTTPYRSDYGLAGRVTHVGLVQPWFTPDFGPKDRPELSLLRGVVVYAHSEELTVAEVPDNSAVSGREVVLDHVVEGLEAGRTLLFVGRPSAMAADAVVGETAVLDRTTVEDGRTTLVLTKPLRQYERASLTIYGNVAFSTHGESRSEVLGSGDAGQTNQRFTLRQSPVTFVPADTPTGGSSTLEVRVNDVLWTEASTLFARGPRDRVYVTRRDDEGKTTVQFGDGRTGARLPGGQENVAAVYRQGIGREGQVKAAQLSLLMTRPLGVREVTNPLPAAGAADPQKTADARRNAPITVLTLDRIVSLEDYQDFARAFTGIAKALATWTWNGDARGVLLTVAGEQGDPVAEGGTLHAKLVTAIGQAGDPRVPLQVKSYTGVAFKIAARVRVDSPTYLSDKVVTAVRDALRTAFSFEARAFGQSVALSQVIEVIQNVSGVIAVDVDRLYLGATPELSPLLMALTPPAGAHARMVHPAELLTLDPSSLSDVEALA